MTTAQVASIVGDPSGGVGRLEEEKDEGRENTKKRELKRRLRAEDTTTLAVSEEEKVGRSVVEKEMVCCRAVDGD